MTEQWKPNLKRTTGHHAEAAAAGQFYTYEAFDNPAEPPQRVKRRKAWLRSMLAKERQKALEASTTKASL